MNYSNTLSLECSHCRTLCQFLEIQNSLSYCKNDRHHHIAYRCTNCRGVIITKWHTGEEDLRLLKKPAKDIYMVYFPLVGNWKPRVDLSSIVNNEVREDFKEAMGCYNNGFYKASMIMARRAIQQEMIINGAKGNNLFKQIESTGISERLKTLLHKIKNFGNHGAHPDFLLFDNDGEKINNEKQFAELSLEFLDRFFADQYEIDALVENAPKSEKELNSGS